jgi:hypothetical protein
VPVGGDSAFGTFIAYLRSLRIPWAIVCDGPALSPACGRHALFEQLRRAGALEADAATPPDPSDFEAWKVFWARHRVFTLAREFGDPDGGSKEKGEIEAYLESLDGARWTEARELFPKSKIRAAHWFAEHVPCPPEVVKLHGTLVQILRGPVGIG